LSRSLKSNIGMVIRLIDFMHQRRTLLCSHRASSMASGTIGCKLGLARLNLRRRDTSGRLGSLWIC
jgi:hypothetical protein